MAGWQSGYAAACKADTSEIKISVLVNINQVKKAIAVLHREFKLD